MIEICASAGYEAAQRFLMFSISSLYVCMCTMNDGSKNE